jgi:hypothetical protein
MMRGSAVLDGGSGNDTLEGGFSSAQLNGGAGDDLLRIAATGDCGVFGGGGRDEIEVLMVSGQNFASGGAEDDLIIIAGYFNGGASVIASLTASGGAGADTYALLGWSRDSSVTIRDFSAGPGGDYFDMRFLLRDDGQFSEGSVSFVQSGSSTLLELDPDGAAGAQAAYTLVTLQNVVAATLGADNLLLPAMAGADLSPVQLVGLAPDAIQLA